MRVLRDIQDEVSKLSISRASDDKLEFLLYFQLIQMLINGSGDALKRIENALKWTSFYNPSEDHKALLDRADLTEKFSDTGKWIFQTEAFCKWDSSDGQGVQSLWLHGSGRINSCVITAAPSYLVTHY